MPVIDGAERSTKVYATNLRFATKMRGVTQIELADAVNAAKQSVNGWFSARRMPNPDFMDRVAEYLNLPLAAFFDENGRCGMDKHVGTQIPFVSEDGTISLVSSSNVTVVVPSQQVNRINPMSCFLFEVKDMAMSPKFKKGDILLCRSTQAVPSGATVIVILSGQAVVRQYSVSSDGMTSFFAPLVFSEDVRTEAFRIDADNYPRIIGTPFSLYRDI